ncbi:hypothetical protein WJR50_05815 [Catalinimonas sp. 4WD22]
MQQTISQHEYIGEQSYPIIHPYCGENSKKMPWLKLPWEGNTTITVKI